MTSEPTPGLPAWQPPPETTGPAPGVRYAEHGARLLSYIVDVLIVVVLIVALVIVLGVLGAILAVAGQGLAAGLSWFGLFVAVFAVSLGYFPYFWVRGGQTPGMRAFGLKVVMDRDGGPVTVGPAILRLIGYWIDSLVFYLGYAWILIDSRRRGWHDLIAGTVVVQTR